jgi:hypothetical protein
VLNDRRDYVACTQTQVGIRLEDCFYVDERGDFVFLTAGVGGPAADPWTP